MSVRPTRRIASIQSPVVPIVAGLIQANPGTISLGQGVVHYGPPGSVEAVLRRFMREPTNHLYTPDWGLAGLVEAIEEKVERENGIAMGERSVVVTAGANMGFLNAVLALIDPGDEVILLAPYYFNHEMAIQLAGGTARIVPTGPDLAPDLGTIEAAIGPRTRAVVTVSPNNPTGMTYQPAVLRAVNRLCGEAGIFHISDEAYEYFVYDGNEHYSPACAGDAVEHTISLFSLSKSYGFAGWRVGYMVVPRGLFEALMKVQDTNVICAASISQHAALACMQAGAAYSAPFREELVAVRALVCEALESLSGVVSAAAANGAFYFYPRINLPIEPFTLVRRLIEEHKVAVIPGSAFGSPSDMQSGCYLRISYGALRREAVSEGIGRLVEGLGAIAREVG